MVRSPQCSKTSALGSGTRNAALLSYASGDGVAECVSERMRNRVLTCCFIAVVIVAGVLMLLASRTHKKAASPVVGLCAGVCVCTRACFGRRDGGEEGGG